MTESQLVSRIRRAIWNFIWLLFFRPTPRLPGFWLWRRFLLRFFGARIGAGARIYPSVKIWAPWNLEMGQKSCLGPRVDCYSVGKIVLEENVIVSQDSTLCAASHDIRDLDFALRIAPIKLCKEVWVASQAFIAPGVTVHTGAVVGARAAVFKDVAPWNVVGGNPAKVISRRKQRKKK